MDDTALNRLGEPKINKPAPITLPVFKFAQSDVDAEIREAAAKVAERKVVRQGLDAWRDINKANSFEAWKSIGAALAVGKAFALRTSGANRAEGRVYCLAFSDWIKAHHFDRMPKSTRSVAIELAENLPAIEAWRSTLTERLRRRLTHPLSNVRRWRKATAPKAKPDPLRAAEIAWRRFTDCLRALPSEQAVPLWQAVHAEAAAFIGMI